jgi:hypothetical protein
MGAKPLIWRLAAKPDEWVVRGPHPPYLIKAIAAFAVKSSSNVLK